MNWEVFGFEYRLDREGLFDSLVQIEAFKEAALNLVLPADWHSSLDRLNRIRAVHGTTALEGNPLSEEEVGHQMELIESPDAGKNAAASKEQLQIRNTGLAQEWVKTRFTKDHSPINLNELLYMHETITKGSDEHNNLPGCFRNFPVQVGTEELGGIHRGAPYERLRQIMDDYIRFIRSDRYEDEHPVVQALIAHFFLVTIHPFGDGNGRVSRLVEAGILFERGYNVQGFYGLSNYFYRYQDQYRMLLQKSRRHYPFELSDFVSFGVQGFAQELKGINNFIKTKLNRVVYRTMLVRALSKRVGPRRRLINQREYALLDFLITETEPKDPFSDEPSRKINLTELLGSRYFGQFYKNVTLRTFIRELSRLSDLGFIRFSRNEPSKDWILELDFEAIGKY